jgi:hypothetical protein
MQPIMEGPGIFQAAGLSLAKILSMLLGVNLPRSVVFLTMGLLAWIFVLCIGTLLAMLTTQLMQLL